MDTEYLQKLQGVGLNDKQARAYLALLELGRGSAASVAAKANLKAPTAYVILKELIEQGFVHRVPKAKKHLFVPELPDLALASVEERVGGFRSIVPSLSALAKKSQSEKTRTLFFEGLAGMKKAYAYRQDELRGGEYLAYFATAENISREVETVLLGWSAAMAKAGVASRAIVPNHASLSVWRKRDKEFLRTVRVVEKNLYSSKNSIEIFPNFVRISLYGQLHCTIIEDAEFAAAQRQIFEMAWATADKG